MEWSYILVLHVLYLKLVLFNDIRCKDRGYFSGEQVKFACHFWYDSTLWDQHMARAINSYTYLLTYLNLQGRVKFYLIKSLQDN